MAFEELAWIDRTNRALPAGKCRLGKAGGLSISPADCPALGGERVTVLVDRETFRLALRKPRAGAAGQGFPLCRAAQSKVRILHIRRILEDLGVVLARAAGVYDLHRVDDLFIVNLPR